MGRSKQRKDKKLKELERKYADRVRRDGKHVVRQDSRAGIVIAAVQNRIGPAPYKANVKGMRWEDGHLVPRKSTGIPAEAQK